MLVIDTREDAETFTLSLLSLTDHEVVKSFKATSDASNDIAAGLCLEEMTRRNLTFEFTFTPDELRAAACSARLRSARASRVRLQTDGNQLLPVSALDRLAAYLDVVADRHEQSGHQLTSPDGTCQPMA